jgi:two-component system chemotaxis response regulator CheB
VPGAQAVVADDSHFMRSVIADILEDGGIEVLGQARHGSEAVDRVAEYEPDVVTMDVEMPEMDGIEAVERIMAETPTPVLMLSAHTAENADVTFEALDAGAVDFFRKPGGEVSMEMSRLEDQLVEMVRSVASADGAIARRASCETAAVTASSTRAWTDNPTLVIGSSTGGPKMVERLLAELPREADFRVLVVQHMPEGFTARFAERIDAGSEYAVAEAADGEWIEGGHVRVAPGGTHLLVAEYRRGAIRLRLTDDPPVNSVRPSVDVTMRSAAEVVDDPLVGVVLTGMGRDGAAGISAIKDVGGRTIVQDEATAAVFGMPERAIATGDVDEILPIDEIPEGIVETATAEVPP